MNVSKANIKVLVSSFKSRIQISSRPFLFVEGGVRLRSFGETPALHGPDAMRRFSWHMQPKRNPGAEGLCSTSCSMCLHNMYLVVIAKFSRSRGAMRASVTSNFVDVVPPVLLQPSMATAWPRPSRLLEKSYNRRIHRIQTQYECIAIDFRYA